MDDMMRQLHGESTSDRVTGWLVAYVFVFVTLPGVAVLVGWAWRLLRWAAGL